jgi:hypothetical protein
VGYIVLPAEVAERVQRGSRLTSAERELVARLPRLAEQLIASIPRLDAVRGILLHQDVPFEGGASTGAAVPVGARLLKVAQDFDALEARGMPAALALDALERRSGLYDPAVLAAMRRVCGVGELTAVVEEMRLADVRHGMIFATDVTSPRGLLLVARGQEVTASLYERIWSSWYAFATNLQVSMIVNGAVLPPAAPTPSA